LAAKNDSIINNYFNLFCVYYNKLLVNNKDAYKLFLWFKGVPKEKIDIHHLNAEKI